MPFHVVRKQHPVGQVPTDENMYYQITPTKERYWVANRTQQSMQEGTDVPTVSYTIAGAALSTEKLASLLPNEMVEASICPGTPSSEISRHQAHIKNHWASNQNHLFLKSIFLAATVTWVGCGETHCILNPR